MPYITFLGAPGSGKGTQAEKLVNHLGLKTLGIGDRMRYEISNKTVIGKQAEEYVKNGQLVPDDIVIDIVKNSISQDMLDNGFIADGFPRNLVQAELYDSFLSNAPLDTLIIYIDVPIEALKERLMARGREDDTEEVIQKRNEVYLGTIQPILDYFGDRVIKIDGNQSPEVVFNSILSVVGTKKVTT
jgi:adenylate kinase